MKEKNSQRSLEVQSAALASPAAGEIQIRPLFVGVCGTDIHLARSRSSVPHRIGERGLILGHEGIAQVVKAGAGVMHVREGDVVALESLVCCSRCESCRKGRFNQCANAVLLGAQSDGLFAGAANVPASVAHVLTAQIRNSGDLLAYACLEPAAVAYHACVEAGMKAGDDVLIFGAGPIGYFCAMLARKLFGANRVYVREPLPARRELVARWCADVFDLHEDLTRVRANVMIEASGFLRNVGEHLSLVKAGGTVVLLARSGEPLVIENVDHIVTNAIAIRGWRGHLGGGYEKLIDLQGSGAIDLGSAVTHVIPSIDELKSKLESDGDFFGRHGKVMVKLNDLR